MINLFSDTQTRPTPAMRAAMADAEVGDEQLGEDPTVNRLQSLAAEMLGKEAALFLPSGTMCNLVAIKTHTQPGDFVLAERRSHIIRAESGSPAMVSGVMIDPIDSPRGIFTPEQVLAAVPPAYSIYHPLPVLLCIEQTHNFGGGAVWPIEHLRAVCKAARSRQIKVHIDGARLFNASVASGVAPREYGALADSIWIDLSKGLGCPVGAVLAGSTEFIRRAGRYKQAFGGGMRQAGIIAAAGIYALQNNIDRLAHDHANARRLVEGLARVPRVKVLYPADTNIVYFNVEGFAAMQFAELAEKNGVRFSAVAVGGSVRAVTHLDVSPDQIEAAIEIVKRLAA